MIIGAQLYTVRLYTQTESDLRESLEKVAKMGYTCVQLSAIGKIDPQRIRALCDEQNLKIVLTHSDVNRILSDTDALIREHDILGCEYIGLGGMPDKYRTDEWCDHFAKDFREPAKKIAAAGKKFMYHNHNFEFERFADGRLFDRLIEAFTAEEMGFTLDTYWVQAAGADVCALLERLRGRVPCVHLKDMAVHGFTPVMAPVLEGNMNFPAILKACEAAGCRYALVEQDTCEESPFLCLEKSCRNLAKLGYR